MTLHFVLERAGVASMVGCLRSSGAVRAQRPLLLRTPLGNRGFVGFAAGAGVTNTLQIKYLKN